MDLLQTRFFLIDFPFFGETFLILIPYKYSTFVSNPCNMLYVSVCMQPHYSLWFFDCKDGGTVFYFIP